MPTPATAPQVRTLRRFEEFQAAGELYSRVFGYSRPDFGLNPNLLSALAQNGGSAVGAYSESDRLVGFAYGFAGLDHHGRSFHYSQAAVVDDAWQGRGIGRTLKLAQRDIALGWGQTAMRWTFDPLLARNAHFNFCSLGAEGVAYAPDYYGREGTDRIVVEWSLTRAADGDPFASIRHLPPPALTESDWGHPIPADGAPAAFGGRWLVLPERGGDDPDSPVNTRIRAAVRALTDDGLILVSCHRTRPTADGTTPARTTATGTAAYLAVRAP